MKHLILWALGALFGLFSSISLACVTPAQLYQAADQRDAEHVNFNKALGCESLSADTLEVALIALGRVGGEVAMNKVLPYLTHEQAHVRQAAAFALGIGGVPTLGEHLVKALDSEIEPSVQYRMALAIGNMGYPKAQPVLTDIINQSDSPEKIRGALQGLVNLSSFHPSLIGSFEHLSSSQLIKALWDPKTQLEASYLMSRRNLMEMQQVDQVLQQLDTLEPRAQAKMIRALANTQLNKVLPMLLTHIQKENIGIRVSAIRGLANFKENPAALAGVLIALKQKDVMSQVTALQTMNNSWLEKDNVHSAVANQLNSDNTWVQYEAMMALIRGDKADRKIVTLWSKSDDPNLQRAAIAYFTKRKDHETLETLAKSDRAIIAKGAQQALNQKAETASSAAATPDRLPELHTVVLNTTKGIIKLKLFEDTPYTSANFLKLVEEGYYDNSYFHRVIHDFVAQGGSNIGDGSGSVGYSIREELSYRSHLPGTVGMATLGKDTGGAQFFINTAPNLHLDSNYTIFGEVIEGMGVAMLLEQNDRVVKAEVLTD
ncbi:peptidylprolyl isomerase [Kangiella marina]|uniref:peptidylprolyl isomerase n=1 Tax=Kangiella marina TaxID=1079178 RepID=A0ABP8IG93_9GAMM